MKILLVRPGRRKQAITLGEFMFSEPIGLECVYTVLKDRYRVRILDLMVGKENFLETCRNWQPEAVGFTSLCVDVQAVLELAGEAKALNQKIITLVGGTQAFLSPESFFHDQIDHVLEYTTSKNLLQLFEHLNRREYVPLLDGIRSRDNHFRSTGVPGSNDYIVPERTSTSQYRKHYSYFGYRPCAIMQTSRGCRSRCGFCLRWIIEGPLEKDEDLEIIIGQIQQIQEPSIMIIDNNFLHNEKRLNKFCDLLEARQIKKNFICYGSAESIVRHVKIMKRLSANGLRAVLVGYETYNDIELAGYNKKTTAKTNIAASKILKESNIDCWASFILHPDWDVHDFKKFRKYVKKLQPEISTLVPMTPFPGSSLFHKYKDRLLFDVTDYHRWSFSLVSIRPGKMSLKRYYFEVLATNLYVNLFMNNACYMVNKFGFGTVIRVLKGSFRFLGTYIRLMLKG